MAGFKVLLLDGRGEEIRYVEKQTTRIFSLIFLSFVEILAMITTYCIKAYVLICERFQKGKKTNIADSRLDKFMIPLM